MSDPAPRFLVPRETPTGVRFLPAPGANYTQGIGSVLVPTFLVAIALLLAAGLVGGYVLVTRWDRLPDWARIAGPLYPLQMALDAALLARLLWRMGKYALGHFEIEVVGDRLRAGRRWGPVWLQVTTVSVPGLRRLVIGRRPDEVFEGKPGTSFDLVAESDDGPPVTLLSAYDEPELVRSVARDLHARLSAGPVVARPLPLPTEEERPAPPVPDPPPLLPGGPWTWLVIHLAGTVGLWPVLGAAWAHDAEAAYLRAAGTGMAFLQGFIVLANIAGIQALRKRQLVT